MTGALVRGALPAQPQAAAAAAPAGVRLMAPNGASAPAPALSQALGQYAPAAGSRRDSLDRNSGSNAFSPSLVDQYNKNKAWSNYGALGNVTGQ